LPADATDLQFDRAEFGGQPVNPACAACQQPVVDRYFDVNGQMTCATCREAIANTLEQGINLAQQLGRSTAVAARAHGGQKRF
jgi:recombinational DNA repair protein (RecF pathway)